ncbi:MAG: hypothetical protein IKP21_00295 [Bacteroidales bacterium]|nr:hypothetical protein [Bacteroidales bacterium]
MNRKIIMLCGLLLAAVLLVACASTSPRTFERTVADVEQNGEKYSQEDWERADVDFDRFCQYYNYDRLQTMSEEEQREVGRLMARYTKARAKSALKDVDGALKTGAALLRGFLEGMGLEIEEENKE